MSTETTTKTETKQQQGVRLAEARMPKLKACLVGIGRLGAYQLDKKQLQKIEATIDRWVAETKAKLNNRQDKDEEAFKL